MWWASFSSPASATDCHPLEQPLFVACVVDVTMFVTSAKAGRGYRTIYDVCQSLCHSVFYSVPRITAKLMDEPISLKLIVMIAPTSGKKCLTFGGVPVADTDSGSLFHFHYHCEIEDFRSHWAVFTTLGEMTDAEKIMNPQHFGSDPADIRIRIRINLKIQIQIPAESLLVEIRRLGGGLRSMSAV